MQINSWLKLGAFLSLGLFTTALTSCEKEDVASTETVENYVVNSVLEIETRSGCGMRGCYEFVFPINIVFPDGATVEVESYDALKAAIRVWRADNPDATERPTLGFPLDVLSEDGEVITVENAVELAELRVACRRGNHDRPGPLRACFRIQFPVTLQLPGGITVTVDDARSLQRVTRRWRQNNRPLRLHAELVFPITVVFEDGTTVEVDSAAELRELKASCETEG